MDAATSKKLSCGGRQKKPNKKEEVSWSTGKPSGRDPCRSNYMAGWYGSLSRSALNVRLYVVDAPEVDRRIGGGGGGAAVAVGEKVARPVPHGNGQPFAVEAREAMVEMVLGQHVCLRVYGVDRYSRLLATVHYLPTRPQEEGEEGKGGSTATPKAADMTAKDAVAAFQTLRMFCASDRHGHTAPSSSTPAHSRSSSSSGSSSGPPMFSAPTSTGRDVVRDAGLDLLAGGLAVMYENTDDLQRQFKKCVVAFVASSAAKKAASSSSGKKEKSVAAFPYPHTSIVATMSEDSATTITSFTAPTAGLLGSRPQPFYNLTACLSLPPFPPHPTPLESLCGDSCFYRNPFLLSLSTPPAQSSLLCSTVAAYVHMCSVHCLGMWTERVAKKQRRGIWSSSKPVSPAAYRKKKSSGRGRGGGRRR
eukprot:GHVS01050907.1.p1 GENE.GHVS01050907.1~~GHVS01050907.1.p1  ORF type:complete len:438 (+),score=117.17 GHVS01050907.1:58-1314(+)